MRHAGTGAEGSSQQADGITSTFGTDTAMFRVSNRLGLAYSSGSGSSQHVHRRPNRGDEAAQGVNRERPCIANRQLNFKGKTHRAAGHHGRDVLLALVDGAQDVEDGALQRSLERGVALGARGTLIGRSFLYGLGALGEAGVTRCLEIIRNELDITMALCGHRDIQNVGRDILLPGTWPA